MDGESLGIVQVGSSAVLCVGHPWCGWRGSGVGQRLVGSLETGVGVWGWGVVVYVVLAESEVFVCVEFD